MAERDFMICRPDSNGGHVVVTSADGRLEKIMFAKKPHLSNMDFHFGPEKCELYITSVPWAVYKEAEWPIRGQLELIRMICRYIEKSILI